MLCDMKRIPKTLQPQRRTFRVARAEPIELMEVLSFANNPIEGVDESTVRSDSEREWELEQEETVQEGFEPPTALTKEQWIEKDGRESIERHAQMLEAQQVIRAVFARIVRCCDEIEEALSDSSVLPPDRIQLAKKAALKFVTVFKGVPRDFTVHVRPSRGPDRHLDVPGKLAAEDLFSLNHLDVRVSESVVERMYWKLWQGITRLDDFRRLRRCSGHKHGRPDYFFLRKKVQRAERYFCSDACRNHFNYNKEPESHGRQRSTEKRDK